MQNAKHKSQNAIVPYAITPHKMNYIQPMNFTNHVNRKAYRNVDNWADNLTNLESTFQISIKVPLTYSKMFIEGDGLFVGFTCSHGGACRSMPNSLF
jgi:phospholipase A1